MRISKRTYARHLVFIFIPSIKECSSATLFKAMVFTLHEFEPPHAPSPNVQTLLAYRDALNEWDYDKYMAVFDDTLEHRILPKSLGRPVLTKKQYAVYCAEVMPLFKKFHVSRDDVTQEACRRPDRAPVSDVYTLADPPGNHRDG